jgi:hypothetical protein
MIDYPLFLDEKHQLLKPHHGVSKKGRNFPGAPARQQGQVAQMRETP